MNREQHCPNCVRHDVKPVFALGSARVVQCSGCGLQFTTTYPDLDAVGQEIYGPDYFARALREQVGRRRVFAQLLDEVESILDEAGKPAGRALGVPDDSAAIAPATPTAVPNTGPRSAGRRLLDIGAGEGTLVVVATERGWRAEGIDVAIEMVRHVRDILGLPMQQGTLEQATLPARSFDVIVMNHVLEHVRDPGSTLRRIGSLLVPGGIVRLEVPNIASLSSRLKSQQSRLGLKRHPWKHYSVEHHFWYFSTVTLRATIARSGLDVLRLSTPARQWDASFLARRITNSIHDRYGWGKHIVAYARRPIDWVETGVERP